MQLIQHIFHTFLSIAEKSGINVISSERPFRIGEIIFSLQWVDTIPFKKVFLTGFRNCYIIPVTQFNNEVILCPGLLE